MKKMLLLFFTGMALSLLSLACNSKSNISPVIPAFTSTPTKTVTSTPVVLACSTPVTGACVAAQKILLVTNGSYFIHNDLKNTLTCGGANATVLDVIVPSNPVYSALTTAGMTLSQFDQVWDCRSPGGSYSAMTGPDTTANTDQNLYKLFLANHGSLFILFESIDPGQFLGMVTFLNNVVSQTPVFTTQLSSPASGWVLNVPGANTVENFSNNCQVLSTAAGALQAGGDGCLPVTQCGGTPLYLNYASGSGYGSGKLTLSVAWLGCQMRGSVSNGKVLILGDAELFGDLSNVCPGTGETDKFVLNAMRFLVKD